MNIFIYSLMPEPTITQKQHIPQVDYIRAIASLAVAVFHLGGKKIPIAGSVTGYGWAGVEMFFFLSGFIICWSIPENYDLSVARKFITKRLIRIEPPYIASMAIALIVNIYWFDHYKFSWTDILLHLAYLNNFFGHTYLSSVYWTLGIEFQFYLFIAITFPFIIKKWGAWAVVALCIPTAFLGDHFGLLPGVLTFFTLGILYYLYRKGIKKLPEVLILGVIVTALAIYEQTLAHALGSLFALLLLILPLKSNSVVSFFSKISFSLYLTHEIIGLKVETFIYLYCSLPYGMMSKGIAFAGAFIFSIAFAYLFYRFIEAPCFRLSKKIKYPSKA
ncbi:acyltransferase family protein [Mucilaginibacter angelicae]|uniref:Acyltransferase family protein n=1 Tax=Mucilaginibacter angelicae TaxID=869718 RepID=A0ABV6LBL2_9SPHI